MLEVSISSSYARDEHKDVKGPEIPEPEIPGPEIPGGTK
jgi:hypothetical protein